MTKLVSLIFLTLFACSSVIASETKGVITTIQPINSLVSAVIGNTGKSISLIPAEISPHEYKLKPSDAKKLQEGNIIFYVSNHLESSVTKVFENLPKNIKIINLMEESEINHLEIRDNEAWERHDHHGHDDHDDHDKHEEGGHDGHDHDYEFDPHIWLDPILVKQQVNVIRDGLIQVDPDNKEHYEENARIYNDKLDALDMKIGSALSSCQKDTIVPYHNAFTYLGERYDIHIMALGGMAPDAEASAAEIAEFVDFVKDNDIKVIFSEELVDPRLAEVIAEEANAQVLLFSPLEALSKDEAGTNVSYIDKMEDNLDSLKVALECQ